MEEAIKYYTANGKRFKLFIDNEQIDGIVDNLAHRINLDYEGKKPLFVVVLRGAMFFAADLIRKINLDCEVDTISAKSYGNEMVSSGKVQVQMNKLKLSGRDVIIIEDIVDSGQTMDTMLKKFADQGAKSIEIVTFLSKPTQRVVHPPVKYIGLEIEPIFVIGYGLDYAEQGRHLSEVYILDEED
jgi:hypoxanthine phosphoribosyltransferase